MLPSWCRRKSWTECVCVESSLVLATSLPHPPALHHFTPSISISRLGTFTNTGWSGKGWSGGGWWAPVPASCTTAVERQRLGVHGSAAVHTAATVTWTEVSVHRFYWTLNLWSLFILDVIVPDFRGMLWDRLYVKMPDVPLRSLNRCTGIRFETAANELIMFRPQWARTSRVCADFNQKLLQVAA